MLEISELYHTGFYFLSLFFIFLCSRRYPVYVAYKVLVVFLFRSEERERRKELSMYIKTNEEATVDFIVAKKKKKK